MSPHLLPYYGLCDSAQLAFSNKVIKFELRRFYILISNYSLNLFYYEQKNYDATMAGFNNDGFDAVIWINPFDGTREP